jgi:hypothetical protein
MIFLETPVKTSIGFLLGTYLSLGTVTSALAAGTNVAAQAGLPEDGVEVIVVTAKRPAAQPVADEPIETIIVTAKRPTKANVDRVAPAMPISLPKLELAAEPLLIRL